MIDVVEFLKSERANNYDVLVKNSQKLKVDTGYCPECKEEQHKQDFKEQYQNPEPTSYQDVKPSIHGNQQHHNIENNKQENNDDLLFL